MKCLWIWVCIIFWGCNACNSEKNIEKLKDIKWELNTLYGEKLPLNDSQKCMFIQFDVQEKRVNGKAVCNRFFGNFEMEKSKLKFSSIGATRMACPDVRMETDFFKMLEAVDAYSIQEDCLSLLSKGKEVATFVKKVALK